MTIDLETLKRVVENDAAIRRVQRLQPVGGTGDKLFPPTYPSETKNSAYILETRRVNGENVECVLLDSVQSQANRLEEVLLSAIHENSISIPHIVVDFNGEKSEEADVSDIGEITSLDAPHRIFDAIIRDSQLDGEDFTNTKIYKALQKAKPTNATQVFELSPTSLIFGAWNSTGEGGGLGAKFTRNLVSEIFGVNVLTGQKAAVRIDPLGIRSDVRIVVDEDMISNWRIVEEGETGVKPSKINHSNIIASITEGGVTIDYAIHNTVISCAGLRRLKFPSSSNDEVARTVLATLSLVAITEQDRMGYALRSRCDLVCEGRNSFEIVKPDGSIEDFQLDSNQAINLYNSAVADLNNAGFIWNEKPVVLKPRQRLVEIVARSRQKAFVGVENTNDA